MKPLSVLQFPTTTLLVDDDPLFWEVLSASLPQKIKGKMFFKPEEALSYLQGAKGETNILDGLVTSVDDGDWEHHRVDVNIYDLHKQVYNPHRFDVVSTVVVDYAMPSMNGLELCAKITDTRIRKVLLTGIADDAVAIEAFNKGLIHQFIRKHDPRLNETISRVLLSEQAEFFGNLSGLFLDIIDITHEEKRFLKDPVFAQYFHTVLEKYDIVEYYLCESRGAFLLIDSVGKDYGFFIQDDALIRSYIELGEPESGWDENDATYEKLKSKSHIFCYHGGENYKLPVPQQWSQYLKEATAVKGNSTYYCAIVPEAIPLEKQVLLSHANYLKKNIK